MNLNEYQEHAKETALTTSERGGLPDLAYYLIGLCDEAGEVAGKVKKLYRDNNGELTVGQRYIIAQELGDVLWYLAMLAHGVGHPLENVATINLDKLARRKAEGLIHGSGDNRKADA